MSEVSAPPSPPAQRTENKTPPMSKKELEPSVSGSSNQTSVPLPPSTSAPVSATVSTTSTLSNASSQSSNGPNKGISGKNDQVRRPDSTGRKEDNILEESPRGRFHRFDEILGKGGFKTVYKAYDSLEGCEVAWNVVRLSGVPEDEKKRIVNEVNLLYTLKHENILEFRGTWVKSRDEIIFITEILGAGSLKQFIKKVKVIRWKVVKRWCTDILNGLLYLHTRDPPVIHRDLKCDNIFINGQRGDLRIGDLGLSRRKEVADKQKTALTLAGTPAFMAPEFYTEHYDEKVDIYALGMCTLEMLTKEYPYYECANTAQIMKLVMDGKLPQSLDSITLPSAKDFITQCLAPDPSLRPCALELSKHEFLRKGKEDDVEVKLGVPIDLKKRASVNLEVGGGKVSPGLPGSKATPNPTPQTTQSQSGAGQGQQSSAQTKQQPPKQASNLQSQQNGGPSNTGNSGGQAKKLTPPPSSINQSAQAPNQPQAQPSQPNGSRSIQQVPPSSQGSHGPPGPSSKATTTKAQGAPIVPLQPVVMNQGGPSTPKKNITTNNPQSQPNLGGQQLQQHTYQVQQGYVPQPHHVPSSNQQILMQQTQTQSNQQYHQKQAQTNQQQQNNLLQQQMDNQQAQSYDNEQVYPSIPSSKTRTDSSDSYEIPFTMHPVVGNNNNTTMNIIGNQDGGLMGGGGGGLMNRSSSNSNIVMSNLNNGVVLQQVSGSGEAQIFGSSNLSDGSGAGGSFDGNLQLVDHHTNNIITDGGGGGGSIETGTGTVFVDTTNDHHDQFSSSISNYHHHLSSNDHHSSDHSLHRHKSGIKYEFDANQESSGKVDVDIEIPISGDLVIVSFPFDFAHDEPLVVAGEMCEAFEIPEQVESIAQILTDIRRNVNQGDGHQGPQCDQVSDDEMDTIVETYVEISPKETLDELETTTQVEDEITANPKELEQAIRSGTKYDEGRLKRMEEFLDAQKKIEEGRKKKYEQEQNALIKKIENQRNLLKTLEEQIKSEFHASSASNSKSLPNQTQNNQNQNIPNNEKVVGNNEILNVEIKNNINPQIVNNDVGQDSTISSSLSIDLPSSSSASSNKSPSPPHAVPSPSKSSFAFIDSSSDPSSTTSSSGVWGNTQSVTKQSTSSTPLVNQSTIPNQMMNVGDNSNPATINLIRVPSNTSTSSISSTNSITTPNNAIINGTMNGLSIGSNASNSSMTSTGSITQQQPQQQPLRMADQIKDMTNSTPSCSASTDANDDHSNGDYPHLAPDLFYPPEGQ